MHKTGKANMGKSLEENIQYFAIEHYYSLPLRPFLKNAEAQYEVLSQWGFS